MRRICFVVTGRVQGVAFRAYTQREAERLLLVGFVRNCGDGTVEGEVEGEVQAVVEFERWLAAGSPWARVDAVEVRVVSLRGDEEGFVVRC